MQLLDKYQHQYKYYLCRIKILLRTGVGRGIRLKNLKEKLGIPLVTRKINREAHAKLKTGTNKDRIKYVIISYPKCGRTWLRYMISLAESHLYNVPIRNTINAIRYTNYNLPRGGYTHGFRPEKPLGEHSFAIQKNNRISGVVFMVRSPERVIISYYYQCLYRDKNYNKSISEFIRDKNYGIRKYIAYLEYYLPIIKESKGLIIRYEDMKTEGIHVLSKVLTYMQLKLDSDVITHIYENSSFENMKKIEANNVFNLIWFKQLDINEKNSRKIRTGGKDNIEEIFSDKDRVYMENVCSISYALKELGYV